MKINKAKFILAAWVVFLEFSCNSKQKEFSIFVQKSYEDLKSRKLKEAYKSASNAIKIDSNKSIAYILRGKSLLQLEEPAEAKKDFNHALNIDSSSTSSLYFLGLIASDENNYPLAISYFNQAIATKGTDTVYFESNNNFSRYSYEDNINMENLRFYRGLAYYYDRNLVEAMKDLLFAADHNYKKGRSFYYIGEIGLERGISDIACKYLNLAVENGYPDAIKDLRKNCK